MAGGLLEVSLPRYCLNDEFIDMSSSSSWSEVADAYMVRGEQAAGE
jgi:hypothetical protein